ncbi:MAG: ATP-binding protein [Bacteroidota bacterium]
MNFWKKEQIRALVIGLLILLSAFITDRLTRVQPNPAWYANQLAVNLHAQENEVRKYLENPVFVRKAIAGRLSESELVEVADKPFTLCFYKEDSLVFWNNNRILPFLNLVTGGEEETASLMRLKNGYYEFIKTYYQSETGEGRFNLIGLIPVKYEFPFENDYLINNFALLEESPGFLTLSAGQTGFPISTVDGEILFYLQTGDVGIVRVWRPLTLFLYILGFFIFGIWLHRTAVHLNKKYFSGFGLIFLLIWVAGIRYLSVKMDWLSGFRELDLFHPRHFASSDLMASLGDFLINIALVLWLVLFFQRYFRIKDLKKWDWKVQYAIAGLGYFLIISGVFGLNQMFRSMTLNSEISLAINNVFSLNGYSIIGLLGLIMLLVCFFFFSFKMTTLVNGVRLSTEVKLGFLGGAILIFTMLNLTNAFDLITLLMLLFSIGFILLFDFFVRQKELTLAWLLTWLFVFSGFSSLLLYNYNNEKEIGIRERYANKLAEEIDPVTEFQFNAVYEKILNDNFIKSFFSNPFIPRKEIIERIDKRYIGGYLFSKYDYSIHLYKQSGAEVRGEDIPFSDLQSRIDEAQATENPYLFFWNDPGKYYAYIAKLPITKGNRPLGYMIIEFNPKPLALAAVYPSLLLDNRLKSSSKFDPYDYAIYINGKRVDQKSKDYPENLAFSVTGDTRFRYFDDEDRTHLIYKADDSKVIIVSRQKEELIKPLSLFSYLFCLQILVVLILFLLNFLTNTLPARSMRINLGQRWTLRNRINFSILAVLLIAFLFIGAITGFYFNREFKQYHDGRLDRKVRAVLATANNEIIKNANNPNFLPDVNALAEIHSMDVNLYDLDGTLIRLSQPEILDKGLISTKIDPVAYYFLTVEGLERYNHGEEISGLKYIAAYLPLRNANKQIVAYMGLPYYSSQGNLRQDVSEFMGALLNVYVLLLLIAGAIALAIGNSVTKPLTTIGQKLRKVKLGETNEPLNWDSEDEIGALVTEYNKMIMELEESVQLLAQSNREMAWREMAKQVAHEIKNPLTPMKLSIQYLQKAASSNPEDIEPLVKRVTSTLVEQIDNLSHIASEFSNFAKMPKATAQRLNINQLVNSVHALFRERENMDISLENPSEEFEVFADKNQLMRVYNNLLKNAIQAIPEDRKGDIQISIFRKGNMVVTKVSDNGVGIPEDKYESVFVPNFTTKNSGTGLGLAISRNIIESAAGKIYFESLLGKGTDFFVELPIVQNGKQ